MKKIIVIFISVLMLLSGCERVIEVDLRRGMYLNVNTVSGMTILIPETYLRTGDTLVVELAHKDSVLVDVFSSTLRFNEKVVTDTVLRKIVNIEGGHDIIFEYDYEGDSWSDTARIEISSKVVHGR